MTVELHLSGYDKNTEELVVEYVVPSERADYVKQIASVTSTDPGVIYAYPLTERQVAKIAGEINTPINIRLYRYFLEAYENS